MPRQPDLILRRSYRLTIRPAAALMSTENAAVSRHSFALTTQLTTIKDLASTLRAVTFLLEETHADHPKFRDYIRGSCLNDMQQLFRRSADTHIRRGHRNHRNPQPIWRQRFAAVRNL